MYNLIQIGLKWPGTYGKGDVLKYILRKGLRVPMEQQ